VLLQKALLLLPRLLVATTVSDGSGRRDRPARRWYGRDRCARESRRVQRGMWRHGQSLLLMHLLLRHGAARERVLVSSLVGAELGSRAE